MITHDAIWAAIDGIAARYTFSPSGLARAAGLDATTFNKSKRFTTSGRERWPSTESIAKVLEATGASFDEFLNLMAAANPQGGVFGHSIPLVDMDLAGEDGFFSDEGVPALEGWDELNFPDRYDEGMYAVEVVADDYEPVYFAGDILIISPAAEIRRGDRVVVKLTGGEVVARQLLRRTARRIELTSITKPTAGEVVESNDYEWMARIVWVRQ